MLFADFAGFTAFVHKRDVEDVRDYLSSIWGRLDGIIAAHGGRTEKHIGDAIMALFGADQAREDDPVQAIRAALAIQACLADWQPKGAEARMQMRIGVHTGLVILGPVAGSEEFTAIGDTVNLANRLEQHAPLGSVLISQETYRQVYGLFDVQPQPPLTVKGRPEPVQSYVVLRAKPRAVAVQLRGVEGVQVRMIGRDLELRRLQSELEQVISARQSRIVTIVGEGGIGKSCLLREFQQWIELLPQNVRCFWGRGRQETTGLPFSVFRDMFCARFEIQENDPPSLAREKLESGLLDFLKTGKDASTNNGGDPLQQAHFIGQLLGFDYSDSPHLLDVLHDSEQVRQRGIQHLSYFFQRASQVTSRGNPTVPVSAALLLVEDLHWSDDSSLDCIASLARSCRETALLILCPARPALLDRHPAWGQDLPRHSRLDLAPLTRDQSRALVAAILSKATTIPQALQELIVSGAEGIPFYIEEIVKMLIDQRVIVVSQDQWQIEPQLLAEARVPATLTGILQARLDGLPPAERRVLQCASVIGRTFWDSAVEQLCAGGKPATDSPSKHILSREDLAAALASLRQKEIVFRSESSSFAGAVEYRFKHELLRNVTYESLLKKLRGKYHARAAAWLLEKSGERVKEFAAVLARHFEQAGQRSEAAQWYGRAGQQARRGYDPALAIEYFSKCVALLSAPEAEVKSPAELLDWYGGLTEVLGAQARFSEALEAANRSRELAERLGDNVRHAQAWNSLAFLQERLGKNRASVSAADRAAALAQTAGIPGRRELIRAFHLKGWACYRLAKASAVLALADQTLKLCTECNERLELATTYKLYGVAHLQLGELDKAEQYFQQGLAVCQKSGDRRNTAAMFNNLGETARSRGNFKKADELYQQALEIAREIGHRESEIVYLTNLSGAKLGLCQFAEAEAALRQVVRLTSSPNSCALAETYTFLGEACLRQGKLAEALEAAQRALALARETENDLYLGGAYRTLGSIVAAIARRQGEAGLGKAAQRWTPRSCFAASVRIFKRMNAQVEQAHTLRAWAEFELEQSRPAEGQRKGRAARSLFQRLGAATEVAHLDALLSTGAAAMGPGRPGPAVCRSAS